MKEAKQAKASTTHSQGESEGEADKTTSSNAQSLGGSNKTASSQGGANPQKSSSGLQSSAAAQNGSGLQGESPAADAVSLLKADHRKVEGLFAQFLSGSSEDKAELVKQVCSELIVHALIEEEIFYPACRVAGVDDDDLDEAQVEHDSAKMLIHELLTSEPDEEYYDAQVKVLSEYVKHHVAEEENQKEGILAKAQQAGIDMNKLGQKLKARKAELMQRVARNELTIPVPRSFHSDPFAQHENAKEQRMDRYQDTPDRDERGRFVSDDDDDRRGRRSSSQSRGRDDDDYRRSRSRSDEDNDNGGRSRGRGDDDNGGRMRSRNDDDYERRSRSRNDDDDDRRSSRGGRSGWSGDSEGHSEAARKGWETRRSEDDDDYRGRSRGGNDDDNRGRSRGRNDDDNRSRSRSRDEDDDRGRGRGGWFGDSRGHSEAARKGWDNPQHGESGWYGDPQGHSQAARRGWDNPQHGESGWFGDPEGHSEASRRGWEERGGGRSSRGRYSDDDDRRSSRSR